MCLEWFLRCACDACVVVCDSHVAVTGSLHKLDRFTAALTVLVLCVQGHIGMIEMYLFPLVSLSRFPSHMTWSICRFSHKIAATACVNWEKCVNNWMIFLRFLFARPNLLLRTFCFLSSIYHVTTNLRLTRHRVMSTNWRTSYVGMVWAAAAERKSKSILCGWAQVAESKRKGRLYHFHIHIRSHIFHWLEFQLDGNTMAHSDTIIV